jgi:hypothetical protein
MICPKRNQRLYLTYSRGTDYDTTGAQNQDEKECSQLHPVSVLDVPGWNYNLFNIE